jgi:hypothetical protein
LLVDLRIVADYQDSVTQIPELLALALIGFFPVGLVVIRAIAKDADARYAVSLVEEVCLGVDS